MTLGKDMWAKKKSWTNKWSEDCKNVSTFKTMRVQEWMQSYARNASGFHTPLISLLCQNRKDELKEKSEI